MSKTITWWEFFKLREPLKFLNKEIKTFEEVGKSIPKWKIEYKIHFSNSLDCPMWTNITNNNIIYINKDLDLYYLYLYHEFGHLVENKKIFQNGSLKSNILLLSKAEYAAELCSLKLAISTKDIHLIHDLIRSVFIDRSRPNLTNEHFLARQKLLISKRYLKLVEDYCDISDLLKMAKEWYLVHELMLKGKDR
jgi:hypothetical protein